MYLPASIIGAVIAWFLIKKTNYPIAFLITFTLYIIGLFGDSYYGIARKYFLLKLFLQSDFPSIRLYKERDIFAPIFFVFGGYIFDNQNRPSLRKASQGLLFVLPLCLEKHLFYITQIFSDTTVCIYSCFRVCISYLTLFYISREKVTKNYAEYH